MDARENHVCAMAELNGPRLLQRQRGELARNSGLNLQRRKSRNLAAAGLLLDALRGVNLQLLAWKGGRVPASLPNARSCEVRPIT
eukprot:12387680-Alexandrium_andersonii.AAC.1